MELSLFKLYLMLRLDDFRAVLLAYAILAPLLTWGFLYYTYSAVSEEQFDKYVSAAKKIFASGTIILAMWVCIPSTSDAIQLYGLNISETTEEVRDAVCPISIN